MRKNHGKTADTGRTVSHRGTREYTSAPVTLTLSALSFSDRALNVSGFFTYKRYVPAGISSISSRDEPPCFS